MSDVQRLLREHKAETARLREEQDARVKGLLASVQEAGALLVEGVNADVGDVFSAQHALEAEARDLQAQAQRFAKQTQQWVALFDQFNSALKELGDVGNWAKYIEADVHAVVATMGAVAEARGAAPPPTR
eukprot:TRINITY_DN7112_c0_g1_i1.p2 TRINITY_DN7112_c0_g1~~TRINITY_DN7112_c0_g1_i1.p2  ORF type:complete len:141 (-),score=43.08 TRINITY_DN7112_c0_g1_i1:148-537(-)